LDSIPPRIPTADWRDRLLIQWARLRESGLSYPWIWLKNRYQWEMRRFQKKDPALTPAEFRSEEIEAGFREACARYEVKPYPGRVDLFRPPMREKYLLGGVRKLNESREYLDRCNHWTPFIQGELVVHIVSGDHDRMVLEPHVRVLATALRERLSAVRQEQDPSSATPSTKGLQLAGKP